MQGWRFILFTLLLGLAAVNTGNNLIYLILSMTASMLIVSWFAVRANMRGLAIETGASEQIFAGSPAAVTLSLISKRKRFSAFDIFVHIDGVKNSQGCRIGRLLSEGTGRCSCAFTPEKRGLLMIGGVLLSSGFPFGLLVRTRRVPVERTILVYPRLVDVDTILADSIAARGNGRGMREGGGDEYFYTRQYRPGDSYRSIHWKASARSAEIMVKEYSLQDTQRAFVYLDNAARQNPDTFEKAVSIAASVSARLIDLDYAVMFMSSDGHETPFANSRLHLYSIFEILAGIGMAGSRRESVSPPSGSYAIAVTVSDGGSSGGNYPAFDLVIDAADIV
ncbi:MAG: DUF58 domain-containing protein [Nitrospirae bacterium]|nr:DUF58 domain-containing protein [Nitrospirota bacterium]